MRAQIVSSHVRQSSIEVTADSAFNYYYYFFFLSTNSSSLGTFKDLRLIKNEAVLLVRFL